MSIEFVWNWLRSRTVAFFGTSNVDYSHFSTIESANLFTFPHQLHAI
jgi:hypothetical protein